MRAGPITVSLTDFSSLSCACFCKANALLQISRFAFQKKSAEINSSTYQMNNFFGEAKLENAVICHIASDETRKNQKLLFVRRDGVNSHPPLEDV